MILPECKIDIWLRKAVISTMPMVRNTPPIFIFSYIQLQDIHTHIHFLFLQDNSGNVCEVLINMCAIRLRLGILYHIWILTMSQ